MRQILLSTAHKNFVTNDSNVVAAAVTTSCHKRELWMRLWLLMAVLVFSACGSSDNGTGLISKQPLPELVEFNTAAVKAQATALELSKLVLGPGGIADRTQAIRTLPLTTAAELKAWCAQRDALRKQLDVATQQSAKFALELASVEQNRRAFLEQQALNFPVIYIDDFDAIQQPLVLEALAIATFSIGAYRFLKGFGELASNTQNIVYATAEGSSESRAAVIKILNKNGVKVADTASSDEVSELFDKQTNDLRIKITNQVEIWNIDQVVEKTGDGYAATERFEEARQDTPEIVNKGGALAVTQTVGFVQSATGGVGNIIGGVPGATVDLALTATEMNPTDIAQRNVTVYVTAGEKEPLPTETSPTPPKDARETIEKAAAGDTSINPEQITDAAVALIQEVSDGLRRTFGPTVQIAKRFAVSGGKLLEKRQDDGTYKQDLSLPLPHFTEGEIAEVVIVRKGTRPQEVVNHTLSANNPIVLDTPPFLGTLSVESEAGLEGAESQLYFLTVTATQIAQSTEIICQGTNAICTPSINTLKSGDSTVFIVEVFGRAELRVIRKDTGETYVLVLNAKLSDDIIPTDPKSELFGKWAVVDSLGHEFGSWTFNADGTSVQVAPDGTPFDYDWTIENGRLELSVNGRAAATETYKIEGNAIYFWSDDTETWSAPYTHQ